MLYVPKLCCCFCCFSFILCTIAFNYGIVYPALLFDFETSLCLLHHLQVCQFGSETPCIYRVHLSPYLGNASEFWKISKRAFIEFHKVNLIRWKYFKFVNAFYINSSVSQWLLKDVQDPFEVKPYYLLPPKYAGILENLETYILSI